MENQTYIADFFTQFKQTISQVDQGEVDRAIELLFNAWRLGKTVYIAGNGGSASTASHFACDLGKWTALAGQPRFRVMALTDNMALYSALVNDEGPASVFSEQLEPFIAAEDVLILISVHGGAGAGNAGAWSQNLLRALDLAQRRGAHTLGLSGFDGGALKEMADVCIVAPVDSTPQVESVHLALEHLICDCLRQKIRQCAKGRD